jgi:hypothetical protein
MAASNYITDKVQSALRAFLRSQTFGSIPDDQIYKGIENATVVSDETIPSTRKVPCIECICQTAATVDEHYLNWLADAEIRIRTNADDTTEDEHHEICSGVLNTITTDTIAEDLSAALLDFTVFLVNFTMQGWELVDRSWVSTLRFQIHCAGSDIS